MFAAWPGVTLTADGATYLNARQIWREAHLAVDPAQTWEWCRSGLAEAARLAGDAGVTLALQNHAPVTNSPDDMLRLIRDVDSPHLKACLDAPLAARQGVTSTSMRDAARAAAALQVLSHFGGEYERLPDGSIRGYDRNPDLTLTPESYYADFAQGMQDIGYDRLHRLRALPPAAEGERRAGRHRLRRHQRAARRRIHARDCYVSSKPGRVSSRRMSLFASGELVNSIFAASHISRL